MSKSIFLSFCLGVLFFLCQDQTPASAFDGRYERGNIPACGAQKFTVSPIDLDLLSHIDPLGATNPPGHTIPTDHVYFHLKPTSGDPAPIYAPGDVYLLEVTGPDDLSQVGDYKMSFALCDEVFAFYIHMGRVSKEVQSAFQNIPCESGYGSGCTRFSNHYVKAGTVLGAAKKSGPFDLGTYDYRKPLAFANPSRYGNVEYGKPRSLYVTCPFDYYTTSRQREFFAKMDRTAAPVCGEVMYDVPGTLQGNWYYKDSSFTNPETWEGQLSFVYDSKDPTLAAISVGGTLMNADVIRFKPSRSGPVNRRFQDVKPSGAIECYDTRRGGRIVLRLKNLDTLEIEHQQGGCAGGYKFTNPTVYNR